MIQKINKIVIYILILLIILFSFAPLISIEGYIGEELNFSLINTVSFDLNANIPLIVFYILFIFSVIFYLLFLFIKNQTLKKFLKISSIFFVASFLIILIDLLFFKTGFFLGIFNGSLTSSITISFNPLIFFLFIALLIIYLFLLGESFKKSDIKIFFFSNASYSFYIALFLSIVFSYSFKLFGLNVLINFFPLLFPFINLLLNKKQTYLVTTFSMYSFICSIDFNSPLEFLYLLLYIFYFSFIFFKKESKTKYSLYVFIDLVSCFIPVFLNILITLIIYNNFSINFFIYDFLIYIAFFVLLFCLGLPFIYLIYKRNLKYQKMF